MLGILSTIVLMGLVQGPRIPRPVPSHRDWGSEPPVAPFGTAELPAEIDAVALTFPVLSQSKWRNDYDEMRAGFRHTGIDIRASKMTPIVAPFDGVIGFKRESFWIYGDNGYSCLGTHLNDDNLGTKDHKADRDLMFAPNLEAGQQVIAGQFIGYVGQSGDATGPHLHFEIYAPGDGATMARIRNPFFALKTAKLLSAPVPVIANVKDAPGPGEIKWEACLRRTDPATHSLTLMLVTTQKSHEPAHAVTAPTWKKLILSDDQLRDAGGWSTLQGTNPQHLLTVFVIKSGGDYKLLRFGLGAGIRP